MQPPGCTRCCGCNERSKRQMLEWDVWAWESPAWAEATSIVNCPITRLSLFRTGRGGGEQRMGQGGGHNSERARMMSDRASRLCGFHREPGCWPPAMRLRLRYLGRLRGRWGPFFLGCRGWAVMWSAGLPAPALALGRGQSDAMRGNARGIRRDGRVSRSSSHRQPLPSRVHGWAFRLTCLHVQLQCLIARS